MGEQRLGDSTLRDILRVLRRRKGLIVLTFGLALAAAIGFTSVQDKRYTATAELLFRDSTIDESIFGIGYFRPVDPQREAETNVRLVSLGTVGTRVARKLRPAVVQGAAVGIVQEGNSDVVAVSVSHTVPAYAALYANTFASEYIDFRREADRAKMREARDLVQDRVEKLTPVERETSRGRTLIERSEQLEIVETLQTGNAELVQEATPPATPSSPNMKRNGVLGGMLGLLLGVALAFLMERLDRRIKDTDELESLLGLPVLGAVPASDAFEHERSDGGLPAIEAEAFRMLRARLRYFNVDRDVRSVLVTSAAPGDGKTTVAWNLAAAAAAAGDTRVLLIEADLRRPRLASHLQVARQPGLSELLTHDLALHQVVQEVHVSTATNGSAGNATFDVIVAGALPPNPAELIESLRMAVLLGDLTTSYDFVVIDTPPTSVVSDAIPMVGRVDGVVVVTSLGRTTRDAATHLREQLRNLNAPLLGVVANRLSASSGGYYGYGYGYGYESDDERSDDERLTVG